MTRVKYKKVNDDIIKSEYRFYVSNINQVLHIVINIKTFNFSVMNQDLKIMFTGKGNNLRSCKDQCRKYLISIGANLYDEVRGV
jgi:hypothetical protein